MSLCVVILCCNCAAVSVTLALRDCFAVTLCISAVRLHEVTDDLLSAVTLCHLAVALHFSPASFLHFCGSLVCFQSHFASFVCLCCDSASVCGRFFTWDNGCFAAFRGCFASLHLVLHIFVAVCFVFLLISHLFMDT